MQSHPQNRYAVIDIGSNSVRLVIFDVSQFPPRQLHNEKFFCALGRDLDRTGKLNPEGKEEAFQGLIRYRDIVRDHQVPRLDVVGTASLREAKDGADFVRMIEDAASLDIRIITGEEEARYAALGVVSLDQQARGIVADFGGGSLEFARLDETGINSMISRPYGAYRALAMGDKAAETISAGLALLQPVYGQARALYTIGGSWRALGQAHMQDAGVTRDSIQGYEINRDDMIEFCTRIIKTDPADLQKVYNFEDKRATLAPVSAFVLCQVLKTLRPDRMIVSTAGIRDGIVYDAIHSAR